MYNRLLYALLQVADSGSFSKAANVLYVSPVSVMKQINALEAHLGLKLLERTSQGVFLTPAGESICESAKEIMTHSEQAIQKARDIAGIEQYTIRIGTSILRPCREFIIFWNSNVINAVPIHLEIVPFDDSPEEMSSMLKSLGEKIDCFISPCDSKTWRKNYNIHVLRNIPCQLAVSKKHRLARKNRLNWKDLEGESIMLIKRGESAVLDNIRDDINTNHKSIKIVDLQNFYDTSVFNHCERNNCFMESMEIWSDVHPSIITIPMDWEYKMPYGIIYSKNPSKGFKKFLECLK